MLEFFETTTGKLVLSGAQAVLIMLLGLVAVKILRNVLTKVLDKTTLDPMLHDFILHAAEILIYIVVILSALQKLGIDSTSIVTVIAACGAAVALALQNSLSNLASGLLVIGNRKLRKGDYILCNGIEGTVESIDLLTTSVLTGDGKEVTVPNSQLTNNALINVTINGTRRVEMTISVAYESNLDKAREILVNLAKEDQRVLSNPSPVCNVWEYADSGINLVFRVWVKSNDFWPVKFDLQNKMLGALTKEGISVPYPQMDVHVDNK